MDQPNIKFVCVSDLHLGAKYSVLTKVDEQTGEIPRHLKLHNAAQSKSGTLIAFAEALRKLLGSSPIEKERPKLMLLGDVLDLSFSNWSDAVGTFTAFIDAIFPADGEWVFSNEIILVPGNHDHQLWKTVKDSYYANELAEGRNPEHLMQTSGLFDEPHLRSELLTSIAKHLPQCQDLKISAAYPNYGVANDQRCVIFHHGHFIEKTYTAMSDLGSWLFQRDEPDTAEKLEAQNGPWINFGWSSLASQGVAEDAEKEYLMMQDPAATHSFITRVANKILSMVSGGVPVSSNDISEAAPGITIRGIVTASLDFAIGKAAGTERNSYMNVLGPGSVHGLKQYLLGPVHRQLLPGKNKAMYELETSFVFGHTHKPFQDQLITRGFRHPVKIFNTGGWVLDLPKFASAQGAAAVVIDDDLNVASLRLFNVPLDGVPKDVMAAGTGGFPDKDNNNPLLVRLRKKLDSMSEWKEFTAQFLKAIQLRARIAALNNFDPTLNPPIKTPNNTQAARASHHEN